MRVNKPLPLKTIIKRILIDLHSRGIIPKPVTQKLYDNLKLKNS